MEVFSLIDTIQSTIIGTAKNNKCPQEVPLQLSETQIALYFLKPLPAQPLTYINNAFILFFSNQPWLLLFHFEDFISHGGNSNNQNSPDRARPLIRPVVGAKTRVESFAATHRKNMCEIIYKERFLCF